MDTAVESASSNEAAKVFLSYSRKDRAFAQRIADALRARDFDVFRDTDDILPTEEWRTRLEQLIGEADTIVFLLSPHSASSEVCAWEVDQAHALDKRIAPIVIDEVDSGKIPPLLARLNFIFCTENDPFDHAVGALIASLNTDIGWIREHTRLAGLAARWTRGGRRTAFLLRGQDIAEAEAWRDTRPKEAPSVTAEQAAFIAESRAAAGRRQRNIVVGAFAVAAVAIALAVFAYLQRIEADAQRVLAEEQRVLAEESAAEAERQRDNVARQLISQSLRSGDFAGAARTLADIEPASDVAHTVAAGLISPDVAGKRDRTGEPFLLNGSLHLSQVGAPPLPLPLTFSATGWVPLGETVLLISDASEVRRIDRSGAVVESIAAREGTRPCGVHRGHQQMMLYSLEYRGYSAGSARLVATFIPNEPGPFVRSFFESQDRIALDGPAGAFDIEAFDLMLLCQDRSVSDRSFRTWDDFDKEIRPLDQVRFPGAEKEDRLWTGPRNLDHNDRVTLDLLRPLGLIKPFAEALRLEPNELSYSGWRGIVSRDGITSFYRTIGGGTGGESTTHCLINGDGDLQCRGFFAVGGPGQVMDADGERLAIYGDKLKESEDFHSLWIMDRDGELTPTGSKERVLSAAFGADGQLAVLETGALLILDRDYREVYRGRRPGQARAIAWLPDGRLILLSSDGVYLGDGPDELAFVALAPPAGVSVSRDSDPHLWIAPAEDSGVVALGYEDKVRLFDTGYKAPISNVFTVPHPFARDTRELTRLPDGGWRLSVSETPYDRRGFDGELADLVFDPAAAFE